MRTTAGSVREIILVTPLDRGFALPAEVVVGRMMSAFPGYEFQVADAPTIGSDDRYEIIPIMGSPDGDGSDRIRMLKPMPAETAHAMRAALDRIAADGAKLN